MQQTPSYESMKPHVRTLSVHLLKAKNLLIQEQRAGPVLPMRPDVRDLIVQIKRGILEFLRFFEVHGSDEYKAFIVAKQRIDEFLIDPRVSEFSQKGLECLELLQHLPEANSIQTQLGEIHDSLVNVRNILTYNPESAYEEPFASLAQRITNGFARCADLLPDFAASDAYKAFCPAAFQVELFLAGLPSIPQSKLEPKVDI